MLRSIYRFVLRLHPPRFREHFGDEMLSIFDQTAGGTEEALKLLADGMASLSRQWLLRPQFWYEPFAAVAAQPADGIPSFSTIDPFRPRASAVIQGLLLSIAVFCLTCFAIKYSWIHVLHVRIPEVQFESPQWIPPTASPGKLRGQITQPALEQAPAQPSVPAAAPGAASKASPQAVVAPTVQNPAGKPSAADDLNVSPNSKAAVRTFSRRALPAVVPQDVLESYAGTYLVEGRGGVTISVTLEQGELMLQVGESKHEMAPVSQTRFLVRGAGNCWIEFVTNNEGETDRFDLYQNGQHSSARRQPPPATDRI